MTFQCQVLRKNTNIFIFISIYDVLARLLSLKVMKVVVKISFSVSRLSATVQKQANSYGIQPKFKANSGFKRVELRLNSRRLQPKYYRKPCSIVQRGAFYQPEVNSNQYQVNIYSIFSNVHLQFFSSSSLVPITRIIIEEEQRKR